MNCGTAQLTDENWVLTCKGTHVFVANVTNKRLHENNKIDKVFFHSQFDVGLEAAALHEYNILFIVVQHSLSMFKSTLVKSAESMRFACWSAVQTKLPSL